MAFSRLKALLRKAAARNDLFKALGSIRNHFQKPNAGTSLKLLVVFHDKGKMLLCRCINGYRLAAVLLGGYEWGLGQVGGYHLIKLEKHTDLILGLIKATSHLRVHTLAK